ncbi:MAG: trimethylamine methyltransferase family protein [Synergistaceae bacterium]|jgi:trimethylamine--corrinoid protein Co-methyltransferase|nr:trimethylamine methyltransferase family protein [Synergistaceae bacterium]
MFPTEVKLSDIENIHEKTLWVFDRVGVDFEAPEASELFKKHGARVDGTRVFITAALFDEALASAASSFTVRGLDSDVTVGEGRPAYAGSSNAFFVLKDGRMRTPVREDLIDALKLCETSRVIAVTNSQPLYASDIPGEIYSAATTALALLYSGKPVITNCGNYEGSVQSLEVARNFFDGEGLYAVGVGNMISPLRYNRESSGAIRAYAEYGQPLVLTCCSAMGMTSPITISGTLIQNNAEVLAGLVYALLLRPGLPVVYGNVSGGLDMRFVTNNAGSFEAISMIRFIKKLALYYGLPARAGGAVSDAKEVDYQAGAESAVGIAATIHSGVDFALHMAGEIDSYNNYSMEKQVMDEEIIERFMSVQRRPVFPGGEGDLDTILGVGPGGQFLTEEQTLENYRDSLYMPAVASKESYATWAAAGETSVFDAAAREVERRLKEYEKPKHSKARREFLNGIIGNL